MRCRLASVLQVHLVTVDGCGDQPACFREQARLFIANCGVSRGSRLGIRWSGFKYIRLSNHLGLNRVEAGCDLKIKPTQSDHVFLSHRAVYLFA